MPPSSSRSRASMNSASVFADREDSRHACGAGPAFALDAFGELPDHGAVLHPAPAQIIVGQLDHAGAVRRFFLDEDQHKAVERQFNRSQTSQISAPCMLYRYFRNVIFNRHPGTLTVVLINRQKVPSSRDHVGPRLEARCRSPGPCNEGLLDGACQQIIASGSSARLRDHAPDDFDVVRRQHGAAGQLLAASGRRQLRAGGRSIYIAVLGVELLRASMNCSRKIILAR